MRIHFLPVLLLFASMSDLPALTPAASGADGDGPEVPQSVAEANDAKTYSREFVAEKISEAYLSELDKKTKYFFGKYPDLDREHTQAMRAYILEQEPVDKFVAEMLSEYEGQPTAESCPRSEFSRYALTFLIDVSERTAEAIVDRQRGIYVAKFVDKDPVRLELFAMDGEKKYTEWIAMVGSEVSREEMVKSGNTGPRGYEYEKGDRFFFFMSSQQSLEDLCGRMGYLIVRDGKIIEVYVTFMN